MKYTGPLGKGSPECSLGREITGNGEPKNRGESAQRLGGVPTPPKPESLVEARGNGAGPSLEGRSKKERSEKKIPELQRTPTYL